MNNDIPAIFINENTSISYERGHLLGEGHFSKAYEIMDISSKNVFACKMYAKSVEKRRLSVIKNDLKTQESLEHKHVLQCKASFNCNGNLYAVFDVCRNGTLLDLLDGRKTLTEVETRFFIGQVLLGLEYLHNEIGVIHGNIKAQSIYLDDNLEIKIGTMRSQIWRDCTHCPPPEILLKKTKCDRMDVWSLGCLVYTLLVGHHPFYERQSSQDATDRLIKINTYTIPTTINNDAVNMIKSMLETKSANRPHVRSLLRHRFLVAGYMPNRLPSTCLTMAPTTDQLKDSDLAYERTTEQSPRTSPQTAPEQSGNNGGRGLLATVVEIPDEMPSTSTYHTQTVGHQQALIISNVQPGADNAYVSELRKENDELKSKVEQMKAQIENFEATIKNKDVRRDTYLLMYVY